MQQVESVSQNNTVSAVFVHVYACVCSCGNTCTHADTGLLKIQVLRFSQLLPRIKLVWNVTLPKTTHQTTWSHISRRAE